MSISMVTGCFADNSTLAHFLSWAQPISTFLGSIGWIQTADSGQVNWATITAAPTTTNSTDTTAYVFKGAWSSATTYTVGNVVTNSGQTWVAVITSTNVTPVQGTTWHCLNYEIWHSNDSLSSTFPIYVKFEYSGTGNTPVLCVTFGTSSDGQGNLGGSLGTRRIMQSTSNATTGWESDFSGSTGWFNILTVRTSNSSNSFYVGVDRSYDSTGNTTSAYIWTGLIWSNTCQTQILQNPVYGGALSADTKIPTILQSGSGVSGLVGNNVLVSPIFPLIGKLDNQIPLLAFCKSPDVAEGATLQINTYGSLHTYLAVGSSNTALPIISTATLTMATSVAALLRWE